MKSIISHISKAYMAMVCLMMLIGGASAANAQTSEVPEINNYWPAKDDENPNELRENVMIYVYFTTSNVVSAKATLTQNGEELGVVEYDSYQGNPNKYLTMDPKKHDNATALDKVEPGRFTFTFTEVKYIDADGNTQSLNSNDAPIGDVTYRRSNPNGTVVSETGFEDKKVLSYFAPDSDKGVKTYSFSKPVSPDNIQVYYEYGNGNAYFEKNIPFTLSDDGLTITIDARGICYSVAELAPGYVFKDDFGNPTDPPTVISMVVKGLRCTDGSNISWTYTALTGDFTYELTRGEILVNYYYEDITLPTPEIYSVKFYSKTNPAETSLQITPDTDMMEILMGSASHVVSADVRLVMLNGSDVIIPSSDIAMDPSIWTCALPANIAENGNQVLSVTLENVTYDQVDGAEHIIKPYVINNKTKEVNTIAEIKTLGANTEVIFKVDGAKITLSRKGYIFMEDENDGLQIETKTDAEVLPEGTLIKGKLVGTYKGYGMLSIDEDESDFYLVPTDVATGKVINSLEELADGKYDNRLVSIIASNELAITYDADENMFVVGEELPAITDLFDEPYNHTDSTYNLTGVYYAALKVLILRTPDDINNGNFTGITDVANAISNSEVYDLRGVKVLDSDIQISKLPKGVYIVSGRKVYVK